MRRRRKARGRKYGGGEAEEESEDEKYEIDHRCEWSLMGHCVDSTTESGMCWIVGG